MCVCVFCVTSVTIVCKSRVASVININILVIPVSL